MEAKGAINQYVPYKNSRTGKIWYSVNLANGVTAFMKMIEGVECNSCCYRLDPRPAKIIVTLAWYRPTRAEFDAMIPEWHHHILNGGLDFGEIGKVQTMPDDPVECDWEYEKFQEWCLSYYGKRLGPLER